MQRSLFAAFDEPPLFEGKELDELDKIAAQATPQDREALKSFASPTNDH